MRKLLWGLVAVFSMLCIASLLLTEYSLLQTRYYDAFVYPTIATEIWLLSHQAELAQRRADFYVMVFGFLSQFGLYLSLWLVGILGALKKL